MLDTPDSGPSERRSSLIANKLSWLNVDIPPLSVVRFPEEDSLQEHGARYTVYWPGNSVAESRLSDVSFMITDSIATKIENQPTRYSDRIVSIHLPLCNL